MKNTSRRKFITDSAKATLFTALGAPLLFENAVACAPTNYAQKTNVFSFSQLPLPYAYAALEPYIDAQTMEIHYTKHHAAYVKNVNDAIAAENISVASADEFFATTSKLSVKARNNGGGAWNHNFFWQVMKPATESMNVPTGKVAEAINASFGSFDAFKEKFTQAGITRFGSGWAWLVVQDSKLVIGSTSNQDNPLMDVSELKGKPLLALDVWEHAYYLKYQNKRNEYIANWWSLVNWNEVAKWM
jgi:superoxide dismutase, Fe-Mn family